MPALGLFFFLPYTPSRSLQIPKATGALSIPRGGGWTPGPGAELPPPRRGEQQRGGGGCRDKPSPRQILLPRGRGSPYLPVPGAVARCRWPVPPLRARRCPQRFASRKHRPDGAGSGSGRPRACAGTAPGTGTGNGNRHREWETAPGMGIPHRWELGWSLGSGTGTAR